MKNIRLHVQVDVANWLQQLQSKFHWCPYEEEEKERQLVRLKKAMVIAKINDLNKTAFILIIIKLQICTQRPEMKNDYNVATIVLRRGMSTAVIGALVFIFTILIARQLYKQTKSRGTLSVQNTSSKTERQVATMMFTIAIVFLLTKIPYSIGQYTRTYAYKKIDINIYKTLNDFLPWAAGVSHINYSCNYFIYMYFMKSFRQAFLTMFCCKGKADRKNSGKSNPSSQEVTTNHI